MCVPAPSVHLEPLAEAPTASVCIAAYQAEGTILAAVLSALTQTWPPLEVVVVDDGSSDGTAQVLADVDDPRLRVLHQANAGEAAAKNAAVQAARGDLVVVLDADDAWYPERLAALMALARAPSRPGRPDDRRRPDRRRADRPPGVRAVVALRGARPAGCPARA